MPYSKRVSQRRTYSGIIFSFVGTAGRGLISIRMLRQGRVGRIWARQIKQGGANARTGGLQAMATRLMNKNLLRFIPVRTGRLRRSLRMILGPRVFANLLGPPPYPGSKGWYAWMANFTSTKSPRYMFRAARATAPRAKRDALAWDRKDKENRRRVDEARAQLASIALIKRRR